MDQTQTQTQALDNQVDNDLQKAIDDITNTTNVDPVFSDPVAAPSSVPEGDTGELGEPIGPFPAPAPRVEVAPPVQEPIAPIDPISIPDLNAPEPEPTPEPAPVPEAAPVADSANIHQIKTAALRDLAPLLGRVNIDPTQKFGIYRDIFEDLKDYTVLEPAYHVAQEISDDTERAEALLYLVESIDKM